MNAEINNEIINIIHRTLSVMVGLPFAFQLWTFILCTSYKRAATNISTTNREIFRSIRLRYTNSTKLNIPLSDTDSFVSKYFFGKGGPFRFVCRIERTSCILLCITLLSTTALYIRGYTDITRMTAIIAASICFYIFRSALSTAKQMELTISFTKDYLDNTLKHRLTPEKIRTRNIKSDTCDSQEPDKVAPANSDTTTTKTIADTTADNRYNSANNKILDALQNENSDIIEAVLQEFLA